MLRTINSGTSWRGKLRNRCPFLYIQGLGGWGMAIFIAFSSFQQTCKGKEVDIAALWMGDGDIHSI